MKLTNNNIHLLPAKTLITTLLAIGSTSSLPSIAYADWGAGIGLNNELMRYEDDDINLTALLNIKYQGERANLDKDGLSYEFIKGEKYAVEVLATSKNQGYEARDINVLKGMKDRDASVDLGGRVIIKTGLGSAVVDVTKDVNQSKGIDASIKLGGIAPHASHWTGKKNVTVAATGGLRYQSEKTVDYYYGVKNSEATATRAAYKGKSATTPFVGVEAQANFSKHFTIDAGLGLEKVANSIQESSIADDDDYQVTANVGFTYWF